VKKAFSLIELLIVIAILGILMAVVAPNLIGKGEEAKVKVTCTQMEHVSQALKMYKINNSMYPTTSEGLGVLVEKKHFEDGKIPKDSWKKQFVYTSNGDEFEIVSFGADKKEGSEDDILYSKCSENQ
jgi:general secretion pathway protein G